MNGIIDQLAHGGAFILAAIGFLIFFLTQIWRAVHVEESYGENLISVKQPKKEWLLLAFILIVGIVVVVRLFMEYGNAGKLPVCPSRRSGHGDRSSDFSGDTYRQPDTVLYQWYPCTRLRLCAVGGCDFR